MGEFYRRPGAPGRGDNQRGQHRCRSWPSRAGGHDAPDPVSRPCRSVRLSDRRYATDRDLTREMPLVVPRDQRNHFLPPVMTTVCPSGCDERGFRLQPRHLEYRLYRIAILVNPEPEPDLAIFHAAGPRELMSVRRRPRNIDGKLAHRTAWQCSSSEFSKFTQTRQHPPSRRGLALCYKGLVTGNGSLSPVASHNSLPPRANSNITGSTFGAQ